ncbi:hypothetical protein RVR_P1130 (plasmid) [Actinacidiphila reveromycinica]|uniref:Uncharacterized protein n=1 Tax=Actinacidiphila reveromycinica TaxID=659352 RepID=A0A7U3LGB0_9ACTN|nr:hypothetical protein [Streptomyces sp. SN-593]BBG20744.1 hypothetical protein RVR_P1130 [Streptomyces sp. SN-593]
MSTTYTVVWEIDLDADDPVSAARKALVIHRDPKSWASVFTVHGPQARSVTVDLDPEGTDPSGNGAPAVTPDACPALPIKS